MIEEPQDIPIYEVPADALKRPWVSGAFPRSIRSQRRPSRPRIASALLGAAVSGLLHVLLIGSVILEARSAKSVRAPEEQGPG